MLHLLRARQITNYFFKLKSLSRQCTIFFELKYMHSAKYAECLNNFCPREQKKSIKSHIECSLKVRWFFRGKKLEAKNFSLRNYFVFNRSCCMEFHFCGNNLWIRIYNKIHNTIRRFRYYWLRSSFVLNQNSINKDLKNLVSVVSNKFIMMNIAMIKEVIFYNKRKCRIKYRISLPQDLM